MNSYLLLRLEAPLMAFGGVAVDALGVSDDFPSASLLVGLFGNALGFRRTQSQDLQELQDRMRYAVRIDRSGHRLTDLQNARLGGSDSGWTTRGKPEGRDGGARTYNSPHQRWRDYHADASLLVAVTLEPAETEPTLDAIAHALDYPIRPLFIGRKSCVPGARLLEKLVPADSLIGALAQSERTPESAMARCIVPTHDAPVGSAVFDHHGLRNWRSDVHQGSQKWAVLAWNSKL